MARFTFLRCFLPLVPDTLSFFGLLLVVAFFVGHIPTGQDYQARRQSLSLSSLLGVLDFEIDVVRVFDPLVVFALEFVRPNCVVFDDLVEVVEEFPVGVHPCTFHVRTGIADYVTVEQLHLLHALQALKNLLKCQVQLHEFLEESDIHPCSSLRRFTSFATSLGGFGYCRSQACCSSLLRNRTLGALPSIRRLSSTACTS